MTPFNYPFTSIPSAEHARPKIYEELDGLKENASGLVAERVRQFSDSSRESNNSTVSTLSSLSAYGYPSIKRSNAPSPVSVSAQIAVPEHREDWWPCPEDEPSHNLDGVNEQVDVIKNVAKISGDKYLPAKLRVATPRYLAGFEGPGEADYLTSMNNVALQSVCMGDWESKRKYSGGGEASPSPEKLCKTTDVMAVEQGTAERERKQSCSTDGLRTELEKYIFPMDKIDGHQPELQMPQNFFMNAPQMPPYPESSTTPPNATTEQHVEKPWWKDFQYGIDGTNNNAEAEGVRHEEDIRDNRFMRSQESFKDEPSPHRSAKSARSPRHYNTPFGSLSPAHRGSQYGALIPRDEQAWPLTQEFYESSATGRDGDSNAAPILIKFLDQSRIDIVEQEPSPTRSSGEATRPDTIIRVRRGGQRPLVLQFSG